MRQEIVFWIDTIENYIRSGVFTDQTALKQNLLVMKYNPNFEWFNCVRIGKHSDSADEIYVNTQEGWENLLDDELEFKDSSETVKRWEVPLIYPFYDSYAKKVEFKILETYFLKAFKTERRLIYKPPIIRALESGKFEKIQRQLRKEWQPKLIESYLNTFPIYKRSEQNLQDYFKSLMTYTFQEELNMERNKLLKLDDEILDKISLDPVILYRYVHEMITSFHLFIRNYLKEWEMIQPRMIELGLVQSRDEFNALERLDNMERGPRQNEIQIEGDNR